MNTERIDHLDEELDYRLDAMLSAESKLEQFANENEENR